MFALLERRPVLGGLLLWVLLLPTSTHFCELALRPFGDAATLAEDGILLRPAATDEAELAEWMLGGTDPEAVVIDSELTVPVFAHRSLFIAIDPGRPWIQQRSSLAGWSISPSLWLTAGFGHSPEEVRRRRQLVRGVLLPTKSPIEERVVGQLQRIAASADLYAVARDPLTRQRLEGEAAFAKVFGNPSAAVFRIGADTGESGAESGRQCSELGDR